MYSFTDLSRDVATARNNLIACVKGMTPQQAHFKPSPEVWSGVDNLEHIDAGQRLAFLRFHMDRHRNQIESLKQRRDFPG